MDVAGALDAEWTDHESKQELETIAVPTVDQEALAMESNDYDAVRFRVLRQRGPFEMATRLLFLPGNWACAVVAQADPAEEDHWDTVGCCFAPPSR